MPLKKFKVFFFFSRRSGISITPPTAGNVVGWLICSSELAVSSHSDSKTIYREEKLRVIMNKANRACDFPEIFN